MVVDQTAAQTQVARGVSQWCYSLDFNERRQRRLFVGIPGEGEGADAGRVRPGASTSSNRRPAT